MSDIYCNVCGTDLGWKYEMAFEQSQKYKEGEPPVLVCGLSLRLCVCACVCVCVCVRARARV